jgi:CRP-like cAMP-binding protein
MTTAMALPRFDIQSIRPKALGEITSLVENYPGVTPMLFAAGDLIIKEGDASKNIYVILQGTYVVEQFSSLLDAPPVRLAEVRCEPETFSIVGEMAYIGDQVRTASVRALTETRALCLKPRHIDSIVTECPMLTLVIWRQFAQRLQDANRIIRETQALNNLWS